MTREDGVRTAEEILGGKWDYAVKARATWLINQSRWNEADESYRDLTGYEEMQDAEIAAARAEHKNRMLLAAFGNAVTP